MKYPFPSLGFKVSILSILEIIVLYAQLMFVMPPVIRSIDGRYAKFAPNNRKKIITLVLNKVNSGMGKWS